MKTTRKFAVFLEIRAKGAKKHRKIPTWFFLGSATESVLKQKTMKLFELTFRVWWRYCIRSWEHWQSSHDCKLVNYFRWTWKPPRYSPRCVWEVPYSLPWTGKSPEHIDLFSKVACERHVSCPETENSQKIFISTLLRCNVSCLNRKAMRRYSCKLAESAA